MAVDALPLAAAVDANVAVKVKGEGVTGNGGGGFRRPSAMDQLYRGREGRRNDTGEGDGNGGDP